MRGEDGIENIKYRTFKTIPYISAEEFINLNPGCCLVYSEEEASVINRHKWMRLFGLDSLAIHFLGGGRYLDDKGELVTIEPDGDGGQIYFFNNCGEFRPFY